jgi:hypothetical protein
MKKTKMLFVVLATSASFLSCTTYHVTSRSTFDRTVKEIITEVELKGYSLSGSSTDTKNNVFVEGTSYSKYSGYGSLMANDFITTDTYRFINEDGNTLSFSVSYKPMKDASQGLLYVTEAATTGCETSNAKQYEGLCGSSSPVIKKIQTLPQDATVRKIDGGFAAFLILILAGGAVVYALEAL